MPSWCQLGFLFQQLTQQGFQGSLPTRQASWSQAACSQGTEAGGTAGQEDWEEAACPLSLLVLPSGREPAVPAQQSSKWLSLSLVMSWL